MSAQHAAQLRWHAENARTAAWALRSAVNDGTNVLSVEQTLARAERLSERRARLLLLAQRQDEHATYLDDHGIERCWVCDASMRTPHGDE